MSDPLTALRPRRDRIPTQVYTPSKVNTSAKNYILNEQKALDKIADTTLRPTDVNVQYKKGNIILEFTAAAFLHFSQTLAQHFYSHPDVTAELHDMQDGRGKIVEQSFSIKNQQNQRQIYRINLYNTTCRAEINGRNHQQFFSELQTIATKMNVIKDYSYMNETIRNECLKHAKASSLHEPNSVQSSDKCIKTKTRPNSNTVHTDDQPTSNHNETCPKCNRRVLSRGVLCAKGLHWIHYACEKLKKVDIDKLENPASDKHYICSHCLDTDNSLMTHSPTSKEVSKQKTTDQSSISLPKQPNYKRTMPIALNSVYTPDKHVKGNPIHVHVSPMEKQTITSAKALLDEELSLRTHSVEGLKTPNVPVLPQQSMSRNQKLNGTSSETGTTDKELRQRESKLKRLEEELKKEKASISDTLKDQSRLKTYSVNMEAKVKELENSNRILRMKIVGTQNQPSDSPTKTRNSLPQNSNNETKLSIESHISSLENNLLKDRIAHIENTRTLYRQMQDMEIQSIQNRLKNLEMAFEQQKSYQQYQPFQTPHSIPNHPAFTMYNPPFSTFNPQFHRLPTPTSVGMQHLYNPAQQIYAPGNFPYGLPPQAMNIPPPSYAGQQPRGVSDPKFKPVPHFEGAQIKYNCNNNQNRLNTLQARRTEVIPNNEIKVCQPELKQPNITETIEISDEPVAQPGVPKHDNLLTDTCAVSTEIGEKQIVDFSKDSITEAVTTIEVVDTSDSSDLEDTQQEIPPVDVHTQETTEQNRSFLAKGGQNLMIT
ncbi:unnamed protein product [Mytilus edulis]|uniref:Zinc finger PHD-type domain-containing protein n=1 Tax=Mytilus edulis TaxID=6550 RepID=A0A8S3RKM2_MYTED|nr:unnamed protein product [Mytilus edulis]